MKSLRVFAALLGAFFTFACATTRPAGRPVEGKPQPRATNGLTPIGTPPRTLVAPTVRVGLLTDQTTAVFGRVDGGYVLVADRGPYQTRRGFTISSPADATAIAWAVQVAALSDQESARSLAQRVTADTAVRADAVFDAAAGVYKVLAGVFPSEDAARPLRDQLIAAGYDKQMLIVKRPSDKPFPHVLRLVDDEGDQYSLESESLLVLPATAETVRIGGEPYRGGARVLINARGLLNVINEVNLEDYVRGVVPSEMGPKTFDELEALKAQALAARTYVIKRLGDFRSEGYDICPGPACQVYKGFSIEDPLTDQAVRETAGQIITWNGAPIDALFTSTCGGETSDVGTMFPDRNEPYLKRARCVELDMRTIAGRADSGLLTDPQTDARLFSVLARLPDAVPAWNAAEAVRAIGEAARIAGVQIAAAPAPFSSRRRDVLRYLATAWNLSAASAALTLPEDRKYFFPNSPADEPEYLAAAFLIKYGITPSQSVDGIDLAAPMPREELLALLMSWLREYGAVKEVTGKIQTIDGRDLTLKSAGKTTRITLPDGIPSFRRIQDRTREYAAVPVLPGDRATVVEARGDVPVALIVQGNYDGAAFDRTSSFSNWTRSYRAPELVDSIRRRNPIQSLTDLQIVRVDPSQRVAELNVIAEGGRAINLKGIVIRWSLNLPDNLFVFTKSKDPDGVDRYTFFGKGWGHGVGMCQVGAYGMAFRGWTADQIIKHYYTGVEIVPYTP